MTRMTRRQTLALIGGGVVLAAGGVAADLMATPTAALDPWNRAGQYSDPRMRALSWAILSPNPHNRQPWMVDLSQDNEVRLYVDTNRPLPHTDPFNRQIVIGLGCFLETLAIAASQDGFQTDADLFPEGAETDKLDARPVAVVRFHSGAAADPDFAHLPDRRTQKEPYDTNRPVPEAVLQKLVGVMRHGARAGATSDADRVQAMIALSQRAFEIEFETPRTYKESVDLFRIGRGEVNANPDGIDFSGPMWQALHRLRMFTRGKALNPDGLAYTSGLDMVRSNVAATVAHVWMCTPGNTRADQIAAGRDWLRLNLATTRLGIGVQPLSQALQEFPEMAGPYAKAHEMMARPGETVQMWARLGYSPKVPQSPRWPIEAKIMHG